MKPIHFFKTYLVRYYVKLYREEIFIGISGGFGKNTCIRACAAVSSLKFKTFENPKTLLKIIPGVQKVILDEWEDYVRPKIVVFTKAYPNSNQMVRQIENLEEDGAAVLNWDDPASKKLAGLCKGRVFFYGMDQNNCTVWAGNVKVENFATSFELNYKAERVKVNFKLLGLNNMYAALAAALLGTVFNIPLTKIKLALEKIEPSEHKMQTLAGPNNSVILDDTYNDSPLGVDDAIDTLLQIPGRRRILVIGEMKEPVELADDLNREIARKVYKEKLDFVFLGQSQTQIIAEELKSLGFWEERLEINMRNSDLVSKLLKTLGKGDVCLVEGPHSVRFDEVVKRIAKKI